MKIITILFEDINLFLVPTPAPGNVISGTVGEAFGIFCGLSPDLDVNYLKWYSPSNNQISANSSELVYVMLINSMLRLFFSELSKADAGTYSCVYNETQTIQILMNVKSKLFVFWSMAISWKANLDLESLDLNVQNRLFLNKRQTPISIEIRWIIIKFEQYYS